METSKDDLRLSDTDTDPCNNRKPIREANAALYTRIGEVKGVKRIWKSVRWILSMTNWSWMHTVWSMDSCLAPRELQESQLLLKFSYLSFPRASTAFRVGSRNNWHKKNFKYEGSPLFNGLALHDSSSAPSAVWPTGPHFHTASSSTLQNTWVPLKTSCVFLGLSHMQGSLHEEKLEPTIPGSMVDALWWTPDRQGFYSYLVGKLTTWPRRDSG